MKQLGSQSMAVHAEAEYLQACGDWKGALKLIEQLYAQDPGNDDLARHYLYLLQGLEGTEASLEEARGFVAAFPDHEGYEILLYDYLQEFGFSGERETLLRQRLRRNPKEIQGWIELGNSLLDQAEEASGTQRRLILEEIDTLCSAVKELALSDHRVLLLDARFAACSGRVEDAEALCLEAVGLDVNDPNPIHALLNLYQLQPVQKRTQNLLRLADRLKEKGSNAEAIETLMLHLAETQGAPKTVALLKAWRTERPHEQMLAKAEVRILTECAQDRKDLETASNLLDDIIVRFPGIARFQYMHIQVLARLNAAGIEDDLEQYIARFPLHIDARSQLALTKLRKNQTGDALAILQEGVAFLPQDRESWRTLAHFLEEQLYDIDAAVEILSASLELMPQDFGLAEYYHHLLCTSGQADTAIQHARSLTERFPEHAYAWHSLASVMVSAGSSISVTAIEQAYKKALSLKSGLFESADGLANLLAMNGRTEEARSVLNSLPNRQVDEHKIAGRSAWIRFIEGDATGAVTSMFKVLQMHTEYQWGWMQMLYWIESDSNLDLARKYLKEVPEALIAPH